MIHDRSSLKKSEQNEKKREKNHNKTDSRIRKRI